MRIIAVLADEGHALDPGDDGFPDRRLHRDAVFGRFGPADVVRRRLCQIHGGNLEFATREVCRPSR